MSVEVKLTDQEIYEEIKAHHAWELRKGILICLGIKPSTYNFENPDSGNTYPQRLYNHCMKNIDRVPELLSLSDGQQGTTEAKILRDDIIKYCYDQWPNLTFKTYRIWKEYIGKKETPPSEKVIKYQKHYDQAVIEEYEKNKKKYDNGSITKFNKSALCRKLNKVYGHNTDGVRTSVKTRDIKWAQENFDT